MDRGSKQRHFSHVKLCLLSLSVVCADEMCSFGLHMALEVYSLKDEVHLGMSSKFCPSWFFSGCETGNAPTSQFFVRYDQSFNK